MVAHSSEFENIVVREEEQNELEMLLRSSCPLEVRGGPSNKHGKISILIQVFGFSCVINCPYHSLRNYSIWLLFCLCQLAVVHISWLDWYLFTGFWCFIYQCKLGSYHAGIVWDLFAQRLEWDVFIHVGILQGCRLPNLASSTST